MPGVRRVRIGGGEEEEEVGIGRRLEGEGCWFWDTEHTIGKTRDAKGRQDSKKEIREEN